MADLDLLRSIGTAAQFGKSQTVCTQNDAGTNMYIVLKGEFGVYINSFTGFPVRVADIGQGSFFGEMSVIDGWPRSATIVSEDEGVALVIEKDNFGLLLEKAPDIASSILDTLRGRALSTAEAVRDAGKEAPELPPLLKAVQFRDAKSSMAFLTMLAQRIRQMNDLLTVSSDADAAEANHPRGGSAKLLPGGYSPFDIEDKNNNSQMLQGKRCTCPYCTLEFDTYIPLFTNLVTKYSSLDGRVVYRDFDILWYTNVVCPNCNYTDAYQEFTRYKYYNHEPKYDGNQFVNAEGFTGFADTHKHTLDEVIKSYYLNIECLRQTSNDLLRHGGAWIRLYWLYSDNKNEIFAKQAAEKARIYYSKYVDKNNHRMTTEDIMRMGAILGELSIALEDFEKAREYFKENTIIGKMLNNDLLRQNIKRYKEIKSL